MLEARLPLAGDALSGASSANGNTLDLGELPASGAFLRALHGADAWVPAGTSLSWNTLSQSCFVVSVQRVTGRLVVSTQGSAADSLLSLYDAQGHLLIQSDDLSPGQSCSRIDQHLLPGTYFLRVSVAGPVGAFSASTGVLTSQWQRATQPFEQIEMTGGVEPYAVVAEDFNGDGHLDLASANNQSNEVAILLGLGDGSFSMPAKSYGVGLSPGGIRAGDFNNDTYLDLAVSNASSNDVTILLGQGDGTFEDGKYRTYAVGTKPRSVYCGDFNGDGNVDLVVPNQTFDNVTILLGVGDGSFVEKINAVDGLQRDKDAGKKNPKMNVLSSPRSVAVGDINGDGRQDLAVASRNNDRVVISLGRGDGTFHASVGAVDMIAQTGPFEAMVADFDRDGHLDLATANDKANNVTVVFGNGDGTFGQRVYYSTGNDSEFGLVGDFNGDGWMDIATGNEGSRNVTVLLNQGEGPGKCTFRKLGGYSIPGNCVPDELAAGDFDHDGRLDLAYVCREGLAGVFHGMGDGTFQSDERFSVGRDPDAMLSGDFNGDGLIDLVTTNGRSDDVSLLLGRGDGGFQAERRFAVGEFPHDIVVADFNFDGRLDLATANERSDDVTVLLGLGDGNFAAPTHWKVGDSPWSLVVGDFNGDQYPDLATANRKSNDISVLIGRKDGGFVVRKTMPVGEFPVKIVTGDYNNDGRADLGTVNLLSHDVSMLWGVCVGEFAPAQQMANFPESVAFRPSAVLGWNGDAIPGPLRESKNFFPRMLAVGDFNGDRNLDLAAADDLPDEISVFLGNGDGTYQTQLRFPTYKDPECIAAADVNDDGKLDLVTTNDTEGKACVLLGMGNGSFHDEVEFEIGDGYEALVMEDFNGDRLPDLATINPGGTLLVLLATDDGKLVKPSSLKKGVKGEYDKYPVALHVQGIAAGDVNGDGIVDLATVSMNGGEKEGGKKNISILLGRKDPSGKADGTFEEKEGGLEFFAETSRSLAMADLDGDGKLDLVTEDQAQRHVWIGWGRGDGTFDVVKRVLDDLPSCLPRDPSLAPLAVGDLNGDRKLDVVTLDESRNRVSILFGGDKENVGGWKEQFVELKPAGGDGPGDVKVGDVNGDKILDLMVANRRSHNISILLGNGDGTFFTKSLIAGGQESQPELQCDFNGDGRPDWAKADDNTNEVTIELNLGQNGTIEAQSLLAEIHSTPILADINGDGKIDSIQITLQGDILARMGNAAGSFDPPQVVNPQQRARDAAVVSTNAGKRLAAVNQDGASISFYGIDDGGPFEDPGRLNCGGFPTRIAAADLNRDGREDLAVILGSRQSVAVYLADANGTFHLGSTAAVGNGPGELSLVDAGSERGGPDGKIDIVVIDKISGDVSMLWNDGQGSFASERQRRLRAAAGPYDVSRNAATSQISVYSLAETAGMAWGDVNEDGVADLILTNRGLDRFSILYGKRSGGFVDPVSPPAYVTGSEPTEVCAADFNGDGHLDLAVLSQDAGTVSIYSGDGLGNFERRFTADAGNCPAGLLAAEVTGDGCLDLLVGNEMGHVLILAGQKDGSARADGTFSRYLCAGSNVTMAVGDLDGDGRQDTVIAEEDCDHLTIWLARGEGFEKSVTFGRADGLAAPRAVEMADLDGDELLDLVVANSRGNNLWVCRGNGGGGFGEPKTFDTGMKPVSLTLKDLNSDKLVDVVIANEMSNDVSVWLGNRQTLLSPGPRPQLRATENGQDVFGRGPVAVEAADYDRDGLVDLLVSNGASNNSFLFPGAGGGFFAQPTIYGSAGQLAVTGLATAQPSLAVLDDRARYLSTYRPFDPSLSAGYSLERGSMGSLSMLSGDMNQDGFGDLVIVYNGEGMISMMPGSGGGFGMPEMLMEGLPSLCAVAMLDVEAAWLLPMVVAIMGDDGLPRPEILRLGREDAELLAGEGGGDLVEAGLKDEGEYYAAFSSEGRQGGETEQEALVAGGGADQSLSGGDGDGEGGGGGPGQELPDPAPPGTTWEQILAELEKIRERVWQAVGPENPVVYEALEQCIVALGLPIAPEDVYEVSNMSAEDLALLARAGIKHLQQQWVDQDSGGRGAEPRLTHQTPAPEAARPGSATGSEREEAATQQRPGIVARLADAVMETAELLVDPANRRSVWTAMGVSAVAMGVAGVYMARRTRTREMGP